ncbi:MAG: TonB-dependent receptor [Alphaproteobacteria bacterium]|nr:MAG: TonB-dependent receptor [Alphaproteobacteria bacterium]
MTVKKSNVKSMLLAGCSVSVIALMTSYSNEATAQDAAQSPGEKLAIEEVIVTSTKRETSIMEVPLAITALTGDFIRDVNLNDIKDIILWTPGITGNSQDSFIDAVSVRGILTNDFGVGGDPSIAFFKNNLYQGRNGVVVSSLYDVERVEALRGPQGFLFGRGAVGGAISVFTKQPELNSTSGYLDLDIGQRNHYVAEGAVNISVNDQFGFRLAGYYSTEDGWVDNIEKPDDPRLLAHEKYSFRATALYQSENVTAVLTLEYEDRKQDGTVYRAIEDSIPFQRLEDLFAPGGLVDTVFGVPTISPPRGDGRDVDQDQGFGGIRDDGEIFNIGFQLDWDLGWANFTSITGYTDHEWIYIEDFDGTNVQINDYLQDQKGDYFQQEFRLTSDTNSRLSWYVGVSFYEENIDAFFSDKENEGLMCIYYFAPYYEAPYYDYNPEEAAYYAMGGSGAYYGAPTYGCQGYYYFDTPGDDPLTGELIETNQAIGKYRGWAGYVNLNYAITDKFDIEVGVRYAKDTKEFSVEAFPITSNLGPFWTLGFLTRPGSEAGGGPLFEKKSWDAFTPSFILRYRPNPNLMLFASAVRGFKPGGFGSFSAEERPGQDELAFGCTGDPSGNPPTQSACDLTNDIAGPDSFEPERVWSYEIGVKGQALGGRIRYDANAFLYKYKDLQLIVAGSGGGTRVDNVGRVTGYGFEGSLQWVISDYVDVRFNAAHTSTELREAQLICPGPDPDACEGDGLSHVPDLSGAAMINFRYPVSGGQIRASAEMYGQTKTSALSASTDPAEVIQAYADLSLRFGYVSDSGWSAWAYVENVTNALYYDGIFAGDGILPGVWFNPSRPRTFGVRITASFGD